MLSSPRVQTHSRAQRRFARGSCDGTPDRLTLGQRRRRRHIPLGRSAEGRAWQLCPVAERRRTSPRAPNARILRGLETIADLGGPEAIQAHQGRAQGLEIPKRALAKRLQRQQLTLVAFLDRGTGL